MKINDIMFAVWQQYGRARAHASINWKAYFWGRGPSRYIAEVGGG